MLTKNDVVLKSTVNFLQPFILTISLFFLVNYQNMGSVVIVYTAGMILLSMIFYYVCYGKRRTNLFFSVVLLKRIVFLIFFLYLLVAWFCILEKQL